LARHRSFHCVWQLDVFEFDQRYEHTPVSGLDIKDLSDIDVYAICFGEHLIKSVLTDDLAERCLRDLIYGLLDILDGDDRLRRVDDPII
jgi:hypothetical protein